MPSGRDASRRDRRRAGQGVVEASLVMVVLFTLVFSIFDLGRAFMCYLTLNEAAALAVEYGTSVDNASAGDLVPPSTSVFQVQTITDTGVTILIGGTRLCTMALPVSAP